MNQIPTDWLATIPRLPEPGDRTTNRAGEQITVTRVTPVAGYYVIAGQLSRDGRGQLDRRVTTAFMAAVAGDGGNHG